MNIIIFVVFAIISFSLIDEMREWAMLPISLVLLGYAFFLKSKLRKLEELVNKTRAELVKRPTATSAQVASHSTVAPQHTDAPTEISSMTPPEWQSAEMTAPTEPSWNEGFTGWLKEDWLLKLGAFVLLLGFGWFVSYAFAEGWIGPVGRITLGVLTGAVILGFGWFRMRRYVRQGGIFLALGSAIILLTIFAARAMYDFFTPATSLVIMFLCPAFVALASVKYRSKALALLSLVLAGLVPLLTNAPPSDHVSLFAYLFVVVLGTVWVTVITGWRVLTLAGLVLITFYSLPHLLWPRAFSLVDLSTLLWFAYAFAIVFFVTNTMGILKGSDEGVKSDTIAAAGNGLLLLAWIRIAAAPEWQSLIIVGWMLIFLVAAFMVFAITKRKEPFFVYTGVAIAMLATATAAQLDGAALTIAYIIESAVIPMIAYMVMHDRIIAERLTLLLIGPAYLSLGSLFANWRTEIPWDHFFVLFLMAGVSLLLGVFFKFLPKGPENSSIVQNLLVTGSVYVYVLLWLSVHASMSTNEDIATMICLVIYTLAGLAAYAYGKLAERKFVLYYGGTLLGFTIAYLLLVSVWDMELFGRVITFFLIGTLLMATAFIGRKKK